MNDGSLQRLQRKLDGMPPARAMGVQLARVDDHSLRISGPLAANINDKGSAFGGSLAGILTLSAWGLVNLRLAEAGFEDAEVYVQDSSLRYLAPLYGDLHADAQLAEGESWDAFIHAYRQKGKARATMHAVVALPDGSPATTLQGRFVALRAKPS